MKEGGDQAEIVAGAHGDAAVVGLAMPPFMENTLQQADAIGEGQMCGPLDPGREVPIPQRAENLCFNEIAAILSAVPGREVRYRQVPFDDFQARLLGSGMSEAFAQGFVDMMRAKNEGMDNAASRISAGTAPTTFRQWAEEALKPAMP